MSDHRCFVYGDNINTDLIFAGKYTYTLRTPEEIAAHALEDLDPTFAKTVQQGDVIVAGRNWGSGSSREQGVTSLKWSGVSIIIAESFSGLYFRNCINQGVHPIVCAGLSTKIRTGDVIRIEGGYIYHNGDNYRIPVLSSSVQAILDAGGLAPMLASKFADKG
ncbi:MAG TPA: 3-isopropylmalate dehydratase [Aggregatilineales bacterium]|nr:3-isopropylmalate dehydratase [Aggregatilineales bacterium]